MTIHQLRIVRTLLVGLSLATAANAQNLVSVSGAQLNATGTMNGTTVTIRYGISAPGSVTGTVGFFRINLSGGCAIANDLASQTTLASPEGWSGNIVPGIEINWFGVPASQVRGGQTLGGFSITANGLIGRCPFQLQPIVDTTLLGIADPEADADLEAYYSQTQAALAALSVSGTTIGPVPAPPVFDRIGSLRSLLTEIDETYSLGWITNRGIQNSFTAKLRTALNALERGNIATATNVLGAFIHEVEAQAGKHLSPQAVVLLKVNTQYLIDRIQ